MLFRGHPDSEFLDVIFLNHVFRWERTINVYVINLLVGNMPTGGGKNLYVNLPDTEVPRERPQVPTLCRIVSTWDVRTAVKVTNGSAANQITSSCLREGLQKRVTNGRGKNYKLHVSGVRLNYHAFPFDHLLTYRNPFQDYANHVVIFPPR